MKSFLKNKKRGFLLIELLVAVFIFTIVALVSISSIISIIDANRKNQALKSVMNNFNLTLDSITRNASVGYDYFCSDRQLEEQDCSTPGSSFAFTSPYDLNGDGSFGDYVLYSLTEDENGGYISRTVNNSDGVRITAPEIDVQSLQFLVLGTNEASFTQQPKVFVTVSGKTKAKPRLESTYFKIQTVISQRLPDIGEL